MKPDLWEVTYKIGKVGEQRGGYVGDTAYYLAATIDDHAVSAGYGQCDYYLQTNDRLCGMGCYDEPVCQTGADGPWPAPPTWWDFVKAIPEAFQAARENQRSASNSHQPNQ